ncbi:MAG: AAA family ATPase [Alphaproteobacteria bacterium]|nr:AAA family ATPase [Alphaproteobacteria bacterium]
MFVTHIVLKNWRNFRSVDETISETTFLIGPNAAGKSNFLDVFRFLRDISKPQGGGLQKAITDRGGIPKLRCLHARRETDVRIEISLADAPDAKNPDWKYVLAFKPDEKGIHRPSIICEQVLRDGRLVLDRPNLEDKKDPEQLTETYLENVRSNKAFREMAEFFSRTTYLHLVPQLLKFGDRIAGHLLEDDPFGQGFLDRIAKSSDKVRVARLRWIEHALTVAIPYFKQLDFERDAAGHPHLKARHEHHRPNAGWQQEGQFSDGTLRLIGLLWSLLEGDALLLLEEPELSLNQSIVEQIPLMLKNILSDRKRRRQVIISTHSEALLSNPGINAKGVLLLNSGNEGTEVRSINDSEANAIESGLSIAEVLLPKTRPSKIEHLGDVF